MSSSVATVVLDGRRYLSSRSGGGRRGRRPAVERQNTTSSPDEKGKEKEKESYTFLEEQDVGRLSSESKVRKRERPVEFVRCVVASYCWNLSVNITK